MGFFLSILYLVTYYLTPTVIFGSFAVFRVQLILAILIVIVSVPKVSESFLGKVPQSIALIGLGFATVVSVIFGVGWLGGGFPAFLVYIPNAFAFFAVCLHCDTKRKLQALVGMLLFVCLFVTVNGWLELRSGKTEAVLQTANEIDESYLLVQRNGPDQYFFRLKGRGEISDPNDFSQIIVCVIPLLFFFWKRDRGLRNLIVVLMPVGILVYAIFLTHSRGALLALMTVLLVALRRRIGTMPAVIVAGVVFAGASALHFTGGRDISAEAGQDRLDLWSSGMELLKSHPLFGVGLNRMPEYAGLTAHNSVVVCAAELGFVGLFFWSMFLFPTLKNVIALSNPKNLTDEQPAPPTEDAGLGPEPSKPELLDKAEISRFGQLVLLSLTGFLVTGWFLSRAFVVTLFLLGGIAEVVYQMALTRGMIAPRWNVTKVLPYAGGLAVSLLVLMYVMLRIGNLMR